MSVDHVQTARDTRARAPAPRCVEHEHDDNPPRCGACARARRLAENTAHERRVEARQREHRATSEEKRRSIDNCTMCDDRGYHGSTLCRHDPAAIERAQRGRDLINEAMGWKPDERAEQ